MTFKRTILLLSLFGLTLTPAFANFSITTDGLYSRRLSGNIGHNNGCGGSLLLELEPSSNFSLGLDLDTLLYWGVVTPGISLVEMVGGVTRFTFNPDDPLPLYLILGGGINPKVAVSGTYLWNGDYHLFGGLGAKFFIDPGTAFDFSAVYDYADSPGNVLQTLQGRIGMSFYLENAHGANKPAATPVPVVDLKPLSRSVSLGTQVDGDMKSGTVRKATFRMDPKDMEGVTDWKLEITDLNGTPLRTYQGKGVPPAELEWDGKDEKGQVVPQGLMAHYRFKATDAAGHEMTSEGTVVPAATPVLEAAPQPTPAPTAEPTPEPTVEAAATPEPTEAPAPEVSAPEAETTPTSTSGGSEEITDRWWAMPLDVDASFKILKDEMAPEHVHADTVRALGRKSSSFFEMLRRKEYGTAKVQDMRATYYAAVAKAYLKEGDLHGAKKYLALALTIRPNNEDALALKDKLAGKKKAKTEEPAAEEPAEKTTQP